MTASGQGIRERYAPSLTMFVVGYYATDGTCCLPLEVRALPTRACLVDLRLGP